jgi:hypothetical protein
MKRFFDETYRWVYYVAVGLLFLACLLRSILMYQQNDLVKALIFLGIWVHNSEQGDHLNGACRSPNSEYADQ